MDGGAESGQGVGGGSAAQMIGGGDPLGLLAIAQRLQQHHLTVRPNRHAFAFAGGIGHQPTGLFGDRHGLGKAVRRLAQFFCRRFRRRLHDPLGVVHKRLIQQFQHPGLIAHSSQPGHRAAPDSHFVIHDRLAQHRVSFGGVQG